jgi:hypothetical protein
MRLFVLTIFIGVVLFAPHLSYAEKVSTASKHDYIKIGFIPTRGAAYKGTPYIDLRAEALAHHKNPDIEAFYKEIKALTSEGVVDNSSEFHQPTVYIEVNFQGDVLRLSYTGMSSKDKYSEYEKAWLELHGEVFLYLTKNISQ